MFVSFSPTFCGNPYLIFYSLEQRAKQPHLCGYLATAARVKYPVACSGVFDWKWILDVAVEKKYSYRRKLLQYTRKWYDAAAFRMRILKNIIDMCEEKHL